LDLGLWTKTGTLNTKIGTFDTKIGTFDTKIGTLNTEIGTLNLLKLLKTQGKLKIAAKNDDFPANTRI